MSLENNAGLAILFDTYNGFTFAVDFKRETPMNDDQIQRAIEFLTQSMAESVVRNAEIEENFKVIQRNFAASQEESKRITEQINSLALVTHDLVTVAVLHSQRLDRLDGLSQS